MTKPFLLTTSWDDGHPLDFRVAELLAKYNLRGTFYIPMEAEGKVMGANEIRQLSATFEVGAHTLHHIELPKVTDVVAQAEVNDSRQWLEQITGKPIPMFCFPRGKYSSRHLTMVGQAGYRGARTVELMSLAPPRRLDDLVLVHTTVQSYPHPAQHYLKNIVQRLALNNFLTYVAYGHRSNWVASAQSLLDACSRSGGVFHLWGHSWEIDQFSQWQQLEEALHLMSEFGSLGHLVTNAEVCCYAGKPKDDPEGNSDQEVI